LLETLGHYRLLEPIGSDRLGEAFRARDTLHGRTVAVRLVGAHIAGDADQRAHLVATARALSALSHPSIAGLYEVAEDAGQLFLACEFVAGETLRQVIAGGALHPRRAIACAAQVADALAEAHAQGIVHGALGPDQIVLTPKGTAKLLDVGLSRWTTGGEPGTAEDDLRTLGATLLEMITGKPAAPGHGPGGGPRTARNQPALPGGLERVVARLMGQEPARYESAAVLAAELRAVVTTLDAKSAAMPLAPAPTVSEPRPPGVWLLIALIVSVAIALAGWAIWRR